MAKQGKSKSSSKRKMGKTYGGMSVKDARIAGQRKMFTDHLRPYTYLATRQMGDKIAIVEKTLPAGNAKTRNPKNDIAVRLKGIDMMMERLFVGTTQRQMAKEAGISEPQVSARLAKARADGVPELAREIFIKEFLPESMVVLQEALRGDDLKLATQVALKVVAGLQIMEDPKKLELASNGVEPESLEIWRAKFIKKPSNVVEGVTVRSITNGSSDNSQSGLEFESPVSNQDQDEREVEDV